MRIGELVIYLFLFLQALFTLIFFLVVKGKAKSQSEIHIVKAKKENPALAYFLISVASNVASYLTLINSSESIRSAIRVLSAPFLLFSLTLLVIASMQFTWAFNKFDFWKMVPGERSSERLKKIHLAAGSLNLFVSVIWAAFYFWI